jgi:hypothetical protein
VTYDDEPTIEEIEEAYVLAMLVEMFAEDRDDRVKAMQLGGSLAEYLDAVTVELCRVEAMARYAMAEGDPS